MRSGLEFFRLRFRFYGLNIHRRVARRFPTGGAAGVPGRQCRGRGGGESPGVIDNVG